MKNMLSIELGHMVGRGPGMLGPEALVDRIASHADGFSQFQDKLRAGEYSPSIPLAPDFDLGSIERVGAALRGKYRNLLVVAIGGSALGFRTVVTALKGPLHNVFPGDDPRVFVVDNVDPAVTATLGAQLDFRETLMIYISKSGSTPEAAANFLYFLDKLRAAGADLTDTVIICDPGNNGINQIASRLNCNLLHMPKRLGGRYSVLSAVGLLPARLLGLPSESFIEGASAAHRAALETPLEDNPYFLLGNLLHLYFEAGRNILFSFAYSNLLQDFNAWLIQLWGESLGKLHDVSGEEIRAGAMPAGGLGATDQHSILQLLKEGPRDKVLGYLRVAHHAVDPPIPSDFEDLPEYAYFAGHTIGEQLAIEQLATEISVHREGNPCFGLTLERLDAHCLGAAFYFYELLVVYLAALDNIDPFDQPGVEAGKVMAYSLMGRTDYAPRKAEQEQLLADYRATNRVLTIG